MLKLQLFYQLKFDSSRLKKNNYTIDISLEQARQNSEVISVGNSSLIRALFRLKKIEFSQKELDKMLFERAKLKKLDNTEQNRLKLLELNEKIEKILFLEDFVSITFSNKSHYREILKRKGFYVNGIRFTPFMASAGQIRRNTALFINNNYKHQLMDILENGRDESIPMVAAKFGAYFSLYSSTTLPVSFPKIAVIPDKEINTIRRVDFVQYKGEGVDDDVQETEKSLKLNAFDGQGFITPRLAELWSKEIDLDYVFSSAVIRAPFLKGMVSVFDIQAFAEKVAHSPTFTDVYGNTQRVDDVDLIVSESMFKLWNAYESTEDYISKCIHNYLGFGIAKVNPKQERSFSKTSYQFLQVLKLDDLDIAKLCEPTIDWFREISGGSAESMLLYAIGESGFEPKDFSKLDISTKAIMINPTLARDRYIQSRFIKTIEKRKKDSYMGSLLVNGNYQFMIADPYYQACHMFKLDAEPMLKEHEHYSEYWINKGVLKVAAIRSPIVHHSEINILCLQNREDTKEWYKHIHSGIIYPANGVGLDFAIHGGADSDGDIVCTINNPLFIKGKIAGLPILYDSKKADKVKVDSRNDEEQVKSQLLGHNSKVGFATNISSSLYAMLEEFPAGSLEHETILKRLKIGRVIQGEIIDSVKGLTVPPFREHWTKYKKPTKEMGEKEKEQQEFNNKIVCEIRPAFFRFLYSHYATRWNKEVKKYNLYCLIMFGKTLEEIWSDSNRSEKENEVLEQYKRHSFFLDNNSVMNKISRYMRTSLALVGKYSSKVSRDFDSTILMNKLINLDDTKLLEMKKCLAEYKSFKRGIWHDAENSFENLDAFIAYLRKKCYNEISSNDSELASYAVACTYNDEVTYVEFAWKMFPGGILDNISNNSPRAITIPVADKNGNIEYLWNKYSLTTYSLED